jgi:SAM-dependent methyltransferase
MKKIVSKIARKIFSEAKLSTELSSDSPIFDHPFYKDITEARLQHLDSLALITPGKTIVDLGCGIGRLSEFFFNKGCEVLCVDGRLENIQKLNELYPSYNTCVVNLETPDILSLGKFDIVACYGILYHLADPFGFIKNIQKICNDIAIIETCISDSEEISLRLVHENLSDPTQALVGIGCRPSPNYVVTCLKLSGFSYIYTPKISPNHEQFQYQRKNDFSSLRDGKLMRGIYIASHHRLSNSNLQEIK